MKYNQLNIRNIILLFLISITLFPILSFAQQADTLLPAKELEPLVITAEKTAVTYSRLMRVVQVISKEDISNLPVQSIENVLEYALNTDIRSRGTFGIQADISIRGGSFDQTMILLNGVNITDPQTGHHNLDLPLDISAIEKIEILQGAGARIFGPNAFNGVINIITSVENCPQAAIAGMAGEHGLYKVNGTLGLKILQSSHQFALGKSASNGFISNTDFEQFNFFYHNKIKTGKSTIEMQSGFSSKDFGANSFYTPKYPLQYEATRTLFASLRINTQKPGFSPVVYWRRHFDRFELFRSDPPSWYTSHNYHRTDVLGSNASYTFIQGKYGKTTAGYDLRYEKIVSNKLGDSLSVPISIPSEATAKYYLGKERLQAALFGEQSVYVGNFSASAGFLVNYQAEIKGRFSIYPGLDAGYQLNELFRIYASANRTLRLPTFTDLYYNDAVSIGNPDLKPEEAISIESGVKFLKNGMSGHLAVFKRYGSNMIDWVKPTAEEKWHAENLTHVDLTGAEISLRSDFNRHFKRDCFISSVSAGYSMITANKSSDNFLSKYVLDILKHKADFQLSHRIIKNVSAHWSLSYQDRAGGYIKYVNGVAETTESAYQPFFLLDSRISWTYKRWMLYLEGSNLLDVNTIDFGNVPQPGRWIRGGFRFSPRINKC